MVTEEELHLMIQSTLDDFDCYPDALNVYFSKIIENLKDNNFKNIYFCFEKIYTYYELDKKTSESFSLFIETKNKLEEFINLNDEILKEKKKLFKFWTSFNEWYENLKKKKSGYFLEEFVYGHYEQDYYEREVWIEDGVDCHETTNYKILYGEDLPDISIKNINIDDVKNYVEMIYSTFLKSGKEGKYPFSVYVNEKFSQFGLSYKIKGGKVRSEAYKTTNTINKILNFEQFERKILFSEQMILHNDLMDKHAALEYISDCFCYFTSLFKGNKEQKNKAIANFISSDTNSNLYKDIENEANNIYLIVNGNYDIRHNEYYNTKTHEPREPLMDSSYIEYLYNRIYGFLFLVRIKYNAKSNDFPNEDIDDELPF